MLNSVLKYTQNNEYTLQKISCPVLSYIFDGWKVGSDTFKSELITALFYFTESQLNYRPTPSVNVPYKDTYPSDMTVCTSDCDFKMLHSTPLKCSEPSKARKQNTL
jgi:hypothetical protein